MHLRHRSRLRLTLAAGAAIVAVYAGVAYMVLPLMWTHYEHQRGLSAFEMVTHTREGIPGDPINVGLVGSKADMLCAMHAAGWYPADPITLRSSFVRRNNDELVATWGNLVNRAVSFAAKNIGSIPAAGELTDADRALLETTSGAFSVVGEHLSHSRFKFAVNESMRAVGEANKYFSEQAPWKLRTSDPERMRTVLHVTLQAIADAKTVLTPFLPRSSQTVYEMLGGTGDWSGMPRIETVDEEGGPSYPVITGEYDSTFRWESRPIAAGTPLSTPVPLFTKLDQSVVDEEVARLGEPSA